VTTNRPVRAAATDSRRLVIAAAIDTILERGYYRASSNEIARRAGVTWGVIQYHFGTREKLLLAALEHAISAHSDFLRQAAIAGDDLADRLQSFGATLWDYYGNDQFLAHLQIIINLIHDPTTADGTIGALESTLEATSKETARLLNDAVAPLELSEEDRRVVFGTLRGLALDDLLLRTYHPNLHNGARPDSAIAAVAEGLSMYLLKHRSGTGGKLRRRAPRKVQRS
jgi:AcrR family transcriptional regulator